jgi:ribonuclease D
MRPPVYVDAAPSLAVLAERLGSQRAFALDTEANPLFAYRERLCLIQISIPGRDYLVDPLVGLDLAPLSGVFADPGITKVAHDAEFDIFTLKRAHPFEFAGLFDTKVAAAALGMKQVGLAALLLETAGVELDKRHQRSDWGKRPLTSGQLDYARRDTHYLLPLAELLRGRLRDAGEPTVLEAAAEFRRIAALVPEEKRFHPDEFVRIKGSERLDPLARRTLRELNIARDRIAREIDYPPFKVLGNDVLLALARSRPADLRALQRVPAMSDKLAERWGEPILAAIARAEKLGPLAELPKLPANGVDALSAEQRDVYERLRGWRRRTAMARGTDPSLVLPRPTMLELVRLRTPRSLEQLEASGLLESWRLLLHGEAILSILRRGPGGKRR